ncbi:hypothetical protein M5G07_03985 [Serratia symbiotica]|nr:hypothetical protein [Serratia symbiotica]
MMALGHGGNLIIVPDDIRQDRQRLASFIRQYMVTHVNFPADPVRPSLHV